MLQSHHNPDKTLQVHVQEVQEAADLILARHSLAVQALVQAWVPLAVKFHDIGKGTTEFQQYIDNPQSYKGSKQSKSHTPMSLYWWYSYAFSRDLDYETILAVAVAVWKHHSEFPTYSGDVGIQESISQYADLLTKQLPGLNLLGLDDTLGLGLSTVQPISVAGTAVHRYFVRNPLPKDAADRNCFEATTLRLRAQLLFSILLEADKAFLALKEGPARDAYKQINTVQIPDTLVFRLFPNQMKTPLDLLRTRVRQDVTAQPLHPVSLVSLPTGLGKTMVAAEWFLKHRIAEDGTQRKVIVVLPFLSIIDQTVKEYQRLLKQEGLESYILESHSLSASNDAQLPKTAELDMEDADDDVTQDDSRDFFAKIWDKPIVITTFDQFLYALLSPKGKHQMRFHNIADALVVMDEIQAIPTRLWTLFSNTVQAMAASCNTCFLIMSATQPGFMPHAKELVRNPVEVFNFQNRYTFVLKHRQPIHIDDFIQDCMQRLESEWKDERVLIVLNTRGSAKKVLRELKELGKKHLGEVYFISGDVTPKERLEQIAYIKEGRSCLVIATQCIEAGVDIDMTVVIRDFAPLDSLIQVAGRGNRNNLLEKPCTVEVVKLTNGNRCYCEMIYGRDNDPFLEKTTAALVSFEELQEKDIYPVIQSYFQQIGATGNTGQRIAEDWAQWNPVDIQKILRGDLEKLDFIVLNQDPDLKFAIEQAHQISEKWERKQELQKLAGRIAKINVSVWAKLGLGQDKIAYQIGYWWALYDNYYVSYEGLKHPQDDRDPDTIIL